MTYARLVPASSDDRYERGLRAYASQFGIAPEEVPSWFEDRFGARWAQAELLEDLGRWAWRHWRITVDLAPGDHEILVRAWDSSAATQPEDEAALWNPKGYANNARPRVRVHAA